MILLKLFLLIGFRTFSTSSENSESGKEGRVVTNNLLSPQVETSYNPPVIRRNSSLDGTSFEESIM